MTLLKMYTIFLFIGGSLFTHSQEKEHTFFNSLYLDVNIGSNYVYYLTNSGAKYETHYHSDNATFLNCESALKYRNNHFLLGAGITIIGGQDFIPNYFGSVGINFLGFSPRLEEYYFGPYFQYGIDLDKSTMYYDTKNFSKIGLESYIKNIHFSIYFSRYNLFDENWRDPLYLNQHYSEIPIHCVGMDLGYAIPFKKKKRKR